MYSHISELPIYSTFYHLLTPWSRVLFHKLNDYELANKFPALYGTRRFIIAYRSTRHPSLSWARSNQSMHPSHFLKIYF